MAFKRRLFGLTSNHSPLPKLEGIFMRFVRCLVPCCLTLLLAFVSQPGAGQTSFGSVVSTSYYWRIHSCRFRNPDKYWNFRTPYRQFRCFRKLQLRESASRELPCRSAKCRLQTLQPGTHSHRSGIGGARRRRSPGRRCAETMTVSDQAPLLQTQSGTIGKVIEGRTVQDTPLNGRNVLNLIALAPGVVPQGSTSGSPLGNQAGGTYTNNTGWGNYQIGGGMANQSAFYLDGAPLNTVNANSPGIVPVQDAIQEFRVDSNSVSAEVRSFLRRRRKHGNQVWIQSVSCQCLRIPAQSSPECKRFLQ